MAFMPQPCLPSRRQQGGNLVSTPNDHAGAVSVKPNRASNRMETARLKPLRYNICIPGVPRVDSRWRHFVKHQRPTRREIFENCIGRGLLLSAIPLSQTRLLSAWEDAEAKAAQPTPKDVLGPFFKKGAPNEGLLHKPGTPGFPLRVTGKVTNTRAEKIPGARIEIWHADHVGIYDLEGFRYRAGLITGASSDYTVETILPGHYDDRPAQHIHYLISAPGHRTLITQAYFATDPYFEGNPDKTYAKMAKSRDQVRTVTLIEAPGTPRAAISFDICLEKA